MIKKKKIAIVGAGFTALSAAYRLQQKGYDVVLFEKRSNPGGLASGYKEKRWEWTLEESYHHWFTNDKNVLRLAEETGQRIIVSRPVTSVYVEENLYQFDSPKNILFFPKLSLFERSRMATAIGMIRYCPFWKPLEGINASDLLPKLMGKCAYKMIWEPQFINKFGKHACEISLAWFWARIKKRTPSLAYPINGFGQFANLLVEKIINSGGKVLFNTEVTMIKCEDGVLLGTAVNGKKLEDKFDAVIVTLPSFSFLRIANQLPKTYKNSLSALKGLGATNLVLRLRRQFFPNKTYWLSICDRSSQIMAIVEHTNFINKKHYNNEHILYLGNYLPSDHPNFLASKEKLLELYNPFLQKINPDYKRNLIDYKLFKHPFAQPIIQTNYSQKLPPLTTPMPNVYLANIEQVYPWDRGTNYAVELGERVAKLVG